MRKLLAFLAIVGALTVVNVQSAEPAPAPKHEKKALTEDQKKLRQELLAKYDANKNGKLDKEELAKMSDEDKKKARQAHLGGGPGDHKKKQ